MIVVRDVVVDVEARVAIEANTADARGWAIRRVDPVLVDSIPNLDVIAAMTVVVSAVVVVVHPLRPRRAEMIRGA